MKKILSLALTFMLVIVLCGCNSRDYAAAEKLFSDGDYAAAADAFAALGDYKDSAVRADEAYLTDAASYTWISDGITLTEDAVRSVLLTPEIQEDGELYTIISNVLDETELKPVEISLCIEFKANSAFECYPEENSLKAAAKSIVADFTKGLYSYIEELINEMFEPYGLSIDDIMQMYDVSNEEELAENLFSVYADELIDEMMSESDMSKYLPQMYASGTYTISEGKMHLDIGGEDAAAEYNAENGTLVLTGEETDSRNKLFADVYTLIFRKA